MTTLSRILVLLNEGHRRGLQLPTRHKKRESMKALIFYENIESAWKAGNSLQNAAYCVDFRVHWKINIVRASLLKFPSVADTTLKDGIDSDLIIFAGCRTSPLSTPLREWLERWARLRLLDHSALASIDEPCSNPRTGQQSDLSIFARRHHLDLITGIDITPTPEVSFRSPAHAVSPAFRSLGARL